MPQSAARPNYASATVNQTLIDVRNSPKEKIVRRTNALDGRAAAFYVAAHNRRKASANGSPNRENRTDGYGEKNRQR